jgi:Holliday junction DNA helicase RuvA
LLGAHGVGPALALAVLSSLSPAALCTAVLEHDLDTLCCVPGVGRKTAARLVIDLKSRLDLPDLSVPTAHEMGDPARSARSEARAALNELGYTPEEIRSALEGASEEVGVEELLRVALRQLAAR